MGIPTDPTFLESSHRIGGNKGGCFRHTVDLHHLALADNFFKIKNAFRGKWGSAADEELEAGKVQILKFPASSSAPGIRWGH